MNLLPLCNCGFINDTIMVGAYVAAPVQALDTVLIIYLSAISQDTNLYVGVS